MATILPGLTQGEPLPNITNTRTDTPNVPDYYNNYLNTLAQSGQTAIGASPDSLVAGFTDLQNQGFQGIGQAAGSFQPGLTSATQLAQQSGNVGQPQINQFMNPYTTNVVDEMARLNQQNVQRNLLPSMKGAFVGSGNLGSQRYANATGQTLADNQANLTGQQYGALSQGYQQSVANALDNARLGLGSATLQGNLAGQQQQLGLTGANAQLQAGALQQQLEQAKLEAPLTRASNAAQLLRGFNIPVGSTTAITGPGQAGQYQASPLSQISSLAALLGGVPTGQGGTLGTQVGTAIGGGLSSLFGSLFGSPTTAPAAFNPGTPVLDQGFDPNMEF